MEERLKEINNKNIYIHVLTHTGFRIHFAMLQFIWRWFIYLFLVLLFLLFLQTPFRIKTALLPGITQAVKFLKIRFKMS